MTAEGRGTARLFVAAWPSAEVCDALAALGRPAEPGVRWTTRDQWHVTLRFLGTANVDDAVASLATLDAPAAVAELGPMVSRLGRDAVVAPVRGLDALAAAVVRATAHVGAPPDPRPFTGHLTLARLRARAACGIAGARLTARFEVREVALVRSDTRPDGARYTTIATQPLRAG
jgi:2'-5' RNA ligase